MELQDEDVELTLLDSQVTTQDTEEASTSATRPMRIIKPHIRYVFEDIVSYALVLSSGDPNTFQEAIKSPEKDR